MRLLESGERRVAFEKAFDLFRSFERLCRICRRCDNARVGLSGRAGARQQGAQFSISAALLRRYGHRAANVENEVDAWSNFFPVESNCQNLRAGIRGPVHMTEVITDRVLPIVLELQRTSGSRAKPLSEPPPYRRSWHCQSKRRCDFVDLGPVK